MEQMFLRLSVMALPFVIAVTVREGIRAYVADRLGDPTAKMEGRLTLNPGAHFDPIQTGLIPLVLLFLGAPFLIGGGKPLNINPQYFADQRKGIVLTTLTGPVANILIAVFFALVARFALGFGLGFDSWVVNTALYGVLINCFFAILTLMPIPPFDGGRALMYLLPYEQGKQLEQVEPFGFFIFIGIIIFIPQVVIVPAAALSGIISSFFGLPSLI